MLDPKSLLAMLRKPPYLIDLPHGPGTARKFVRQLFVRKTSPHLLSLPHSNLQAVTSIVNKHR